MWVCVCVPDIHPAYCLTFRLFGETVVFYAAGAVNEDAERERERCGSDRAERSKEILI